MASPLLEDYLFLVPLIVERVKVQLLELDVLPIEAMAQAQERSVRTSTGFVPISPPSTSRYSSSVLVSSCEML